MRERERERERVSFFWGGGVNEANSFIYVDEKNSENVYRLLARVRMCV